MWECSKADRAGEADEPAQGMCFALSIFLLLVCSSGVVLQVPSRLSCWETNYSLPILICNEPREDT